MVIVGASLDGVSEVILTSLFPVIFDEELFVIYYRTWVSSQRLSVYDLVLTSSFSMIFCENLFVIFFSYSCCLSNISSYWAKMSWRLVSR